MSISRLTVPIVLLVSIAPLFFGRNSASAQAIETVGSDETLEIATWNIEWFGASGSGQGPSDIVQQRANVRRVIAESAIDLWAVQEISETSQWRFLLDELGPDWAGELAELSGQQRIGFLFNTGRIQLRQVKHILDSYAEGPIPPAGTNYFAGRAPLQLRVDVVLPDTTVRLTFITLHMKCCSDESSYLRRVEASSRLQTHIDFGRDFLQEPIAAVLGDFNDELSGSIRIGQPSPYTNFLNAPESYRFLTLPLDEQNVATFCSTTDCTFGSTLDHILITDEVFANYVDDSVGRLESVLTAIPNYTNSTSDHLPVYAVFSFPTSTAVEHSPELPKVSPTFSVYPNPARGILHIDPDAAFDSYLRVSVYDVLGRKVYSETRSNNRGNESFAISTADFPTGLYVVLLDFSGQIASRTFLKIE